MARRVVLRERDFTMMFVQVVDLLFYKFIPVDGIDAHILWLWSNDSGRLDLRSVEPCNVSVKKG